MEVRRTKESWFLDTYDMPLDERRKFFPGWAAEVLLLYIRLNLTKFFFGLEKHCLELPYYQNKFDSHLDRRVSKSLQNFIFEFIHFYAYSTYQSCIRAPHKVIRVLARILGFLKNSNYTQTSALTSIVHVISSAPYLSALDAPFSLLS